MEKQAFIEHCNSEIAKLTERVAQQRENLATLEAGIQRLQQVRDAWIDARPFETDAPPVDDPRKH